MGREWAFLAFTKNDDGFELGMYKGAYFQGEDKTEKIESISTEKNSCYMRVHVDYKNVCTFSYSFDGTNFNHMGNEFTAMQGVWIGAKMGLFSINPNIEKSKGYADFECFRVE